MTLTELVNAAKKQDDYAIGQLMDRVKQKGKYVALKYVHDDMRAEDILQDAFIRAFSNLDQLEDPEKFDAWFFVILNNLGKNATNMKMIDKNSSYFSDLDSEDMNFEDSISQDYTEFQPKENFDYSELKEGVQKILDELPDAQRIAVIGYFFEGLNMREIADIFDVGESTIRARLNSAKKKMAETIKSLEAKGMPLFGAVPASVFNWFASQEASQVVLHRVSVSTVIQGLTASASAGLGSAASSASTVTTQVAVETVKKGTAGAVKSAAVKAVSVKAVVTTVATVAVVTTGTVVYMNSPSYQQNHQEPEYSEVNEQEFAEVEPEEDWKTKYEQDLPVYTDRFGYTYFNLIDFDEDGVPEVYCENDAGSSMIISSGQPSGESDGLFALQLTDSHNQIVQYNKNIIVTYDDMTYGQVVYEVSNGTINALHRSETFPDQTAFADPNQWAWDGNRMTYDEWESLRQQYVPASLQVLSITKPIDPRGVQERGTGVSYDELMEQIRNY